MYQLRMNCNIIILLFVFSLFDVKHFIKTDFYFQKKMSMRGGRGQESYRGAHAYTAPRPRVEDTYTSGRNRMPQDSYSAARHYSGSYRDLYTDSYTERGYGSQSTGNIFCKGVIQVRVGFLIPFNLIFNNFQVINSRKIHVIEMIFEFKIG